MKKRNGAHDYAACTARARLCATIYTAESRADVTSLRVTDRWTGGYVQRSTERDWREMDVKVPTRKDLD
jgi:hypothetical protein